MTKKVSKIEEQRIRDEMIRKEYRIGMTAAAAALGVTRSTIQTWVANGAPVVRKAEGGRGGKPYIFSLTALKIWRGYSSRSDYTTEHDDNEVRGENTSEISQLKLRKMRAETIELETRVADRLSQLVEKELAIEEIGRAATFFRKTLEPIPAQLAPKLASEMRPGQVQKILTDAINELLHEIASYDGQVAD